MVSYKLLHWSPSSATTLSWLARGVVITVAVGSLLLLTAHKSDALPLNTYSFLDHSDDLYETLRETIAAAPANHSAGWTDEEGPLHHLGAPASFVELANSDVLDARTGEPFSEDLEGGVFNLAVLKLPPGSRFQLLGVARGPTRQHPFMAVKGHPGREQSLVV